MENLQKQSPDQPPRHIDNVENLSNPEVDAEEKEKHSSTADITELLEYDINHINSRGRVQRTSPEVIEHIHDAIDVLPEEVKDALYQYAFERDLELYGEQTQSSSSQASLRMSNERRQKAHDHAATLLSEYDPEHYPDMITARFAIQRWFGELVSKDVADAHYDNRF